MLNMLELVPKNGPKKDFFLIACGHRVPRAAALPVRILISYIEES